MPSLLPISIIWDLLGFKLKSLIYFFAAVSKWVLNDFEVEDEEELAMESLKNRVGALLESYIEKKEVKKTTNPNPKKYIIEKINNLGKLNKTLKEIGYSVEETMYREISKFGGLFRCSTLPLERK